MIGIDTVRKAVYEYFWNLCGDKAMCNRLVELAGVKESQIGQSIMKAGERAEYIFLVITGLVRGFYIDNEGNDITKCFSMEGEWCCSYNYLTKEPSTFYIETIEDTVLARFDIESIKTFVEEYPSLRDAMERLIRSTLIQSEKRILSFAAMEAKDRYLSLLQENPELIKRAKQEYIASYIGITPSSLSRIKRYL